MYKIENILNTLLEYKALHEEFSQTELNQQWTEKLGEINGMLEGTISAIRESVIANGGKVPDLRSFGKEGIEAFPVTHLDNLTLLKRMIKDRLFRTREVTHGSKYYFIGNAIRSVEKALHICANLIANRDIYFQQEDFKEKLNDIASKEIKPLVQYTEQLIKQAHEAERII